MVMARGFISRPGDSPCRPQTKSGLPGGEGWPTQPEPHADNMSAHAARHFATGFVAVIGNFGATFRHLRCIAIGAEGKVSSRFPG
jgi:hypothetical protein